MSGHYARVAERAIHRCEYCRAPEAIFNFAFEVDHIIPVSEDGIDDESNMSLACRSCNAFKLNYVTGLDPEQQEQVALFHPRHALWDEHFRANEMTGAIEGLTATGRATISRLRMNSPLQTVARRVWMRLGLFP